MAVVQLHLLFTLYFRTMNAKNNNPSKTVLTISVGFAIVFLLTKLNGFLYASIFIGLVGLVSDKLAKMVDFLWMKLAKVLSFIVPNILLSLIFYVFLFPISLLSKIFGSSDTLQLKNNKDSIWVVNNKQIEKDSFEKMW